GFSSTSPDMVPRRPTWVPVLMNQAIEPEQSSAPQVISSGMRPSASAKLACGRQTPAQAPAGAPSIWPTNTPRPSPSSRSTQQEKQPRCSDLAANGEVAAKRRASSTLGGAGGSGMEPSASGLAVATS